MGMEAKDELDLFVYLITNKQIESHIVLINDLLPQKIRVIKNKISLLENAIDLILEEYMEDPLDESSTSSDGLEKISEEDDQLENTKSANI